MTAQPQLGAHVHDLVVRKSLEEALSWYHQQPVRWIWWKYGGWCTVGEIDTGVPGDLLHLVLSAAHDAFLGAWHVSGVQIVQAVTMGSMAGFFPLCARVSPWTALFRTKDSSSTVSLWAWTDSSTSTTSLHQPCATLFHLSPWPSRHPWINSIYARFQLLRFNSTAGLALLRKYNSRQAPGLQMKAEATLSIFWKGAWMAVIVSFCFSDNNNISSSARESFRLWVFFIPSSPSPTQHNSIRNNDTQHQQYCIQITASGVSSSCCVTSRKQAVRLRALEC